MPLRRVRAPQVALHGVLLILLALTFYPAIQMLIFSFKNPEQWKYSRWLPTFPLRVQTYSIAWDNIAHYLLNTIFVGVVGTAGMLVLSSLTAFVFARMRFPGRELLYFAIISMLMVPSVLSLIPQFVLYHNLHLLNTYGALIVPIISGGSIFGLFVLRAFFVSLPEELFEAARMDGCSVLGLYWRICIPLSYPILGTLAILQIVSTWNDYIWPSLAVENDNLQVITVGLVRLTSNMGNASPGADPNAAYGPLFASYTLAALPILVLFLFASKYYIEGLVSSGLKL
jgi:ABC-type glycerol-3-phosphate transport system permease component